MKKSIGVLCQYARLALLDLKIDTDAALAARIVMTHGGSERELRIGLRMAQRELLRYERLGSHDDAVKEIGEFLGTCSL